MPLILLAFLAVTAASPKVAVLPVQRSKAAAKVPAIIDDLIMTAVQKLGDFQVIGRDDINDMLGFEKQKDLLGCDNVSCVAEVGGALGVERVVSIKIDRVKDRWVVSTKLINMKTVAVESRDSTFVQGDDAALLDAVPGFIGKLFGRTEPSASAEPAEQAPCDRACLERCDRHDAVACHVLGWKLLHGRGFPRDEPRARSLFEASCKTNPSTCDGIGFVRLDLATPADDREALLSFRRSCDAGNPSGCAGQAWMLAEARGVARDEAKARTMMASACEHGVLRGCHGYAWLLFQGRGGAKDEAAAFATSQRVCERDPHFCDGLGWQYADGKGVAKDEARAVGYFRQACDTDNQWGCSGLGWMYADGRGIAKDEKRGHELFVQACDRNIAGGCHGLGWMVANGRGAGKDEAAAVRGFQRACDIMPFFCDGLAWMQADGRGTKRDEAGAVALFQRSCEWRNDWACYGLGFMLDSGRGGVRDPVKAAAMFTQACAGKVAPACERSHKR